VLAEQAPEVEDFWAASRVARYLGGKSLARVEDLMARQQIKSVKGGPNNGRLTKKSWVDEWLNAKPMKSKAGRPPKHTKAAPQPPRMEA
jgi:hypothetical protein